MFLLLLGTVPHPITTRSLWKDIYEGGPYEIAFVGASMVQGAIDPRIIDIILDKKTINVGSANQKTLDSYYAIKELYKLSPRELVVLMNVSNSTLVREFQSVEGTRYMFDFMKLSPNKMEYLLAAFKDDYRINALFPGIHYVTIDKLNPIEMFKLAKEKLLYPDKRERYVERGFAPKKQNFKNVQSLGRLRDIFSFSPEKIIPENLYYLQKIIDFCQSKGIKIILFTTPNLPYSFDLANRKDFHDFISNFAKKNNVPYLDFNYAKPKIFIPETRYYFDNRHMNEKGAKAFSTGLANFLLEYQKDTYNEDDFFYRYEELIQTWNTVFGVWLNVDASTQDLYANVSAPPYRQVEYEFSTVKSNKRDYNVYRPYSTNRFAETGKLPAGEYQIRVNARLVGSDEPFQQYFITEFTKK